MGDYFDLGSYRRDITSDSQDAVTWFNRGLVWCYGFNQEEGVRCFRKAIEIDPECAMAYWGVAYASGPFYNKPWAWYGEIERVETIALCHEHAHYARQLMTRASPVEQALIEALCSKHPATRALDDIELEHWMQNYADAMRSVYARFSEDPDVACLTAEAVINLQRFLLGSRVVGAAGRCVRGGDRLGLLRLRVLNHDRAGHDLRHGR